MRPADIQTRENLFFLHEQSIVVCQCQDYIPNFGSRSCNYSIFACYSLAPIYTRQNRRQNIHVTGDWTCAACKISICIYVPSYPCVRGSVAGKATLLPVTFHACTAYVS